MFAKLKAIFSKQGYLVWQNKSLEINKITIYEQKNNGNQKMWTFPDMNYL